MLRVLKACAAGGVDGLLSQAMGMPCSTSQCSASTRAVNTRSGRRGMAGFLQASGADRAQVVRQPGGLAPRFLQQKADLHGRGAGTFFFIHSHQKFANFVQLNPWNPA